MQKKSFFLPSNCDGLELYISIFEPERDVKGIVQFSHGMVEHQIYYYELMEYLTNHGYITVIHDHRGHGKSARNDEDLGYFYEEKADFLIEDMHQVTEYLREKYGNLPISLFGHSMGSLIVRKYLKKYDSEIEKVIVCGSPSINSMSGLGHFLCQVVKLFRGERYRSRFLNGLALTNEPGDKWLTINSNYVAEYMNDKYCSYIFTVNGFLNLTQLMKDVYSKRGWSLQHLDIPILFLAGRDDIVIQSETKFLKSIRFLQELGYTKVSYKLYDGCKHAIFKDKPEEVFLDVLKFIEK